jgi:hypothetical protein
MVVQNSNVHLGGQVFMRGETAQRWDAAIVAQQVRETEQVRPSFTR